MNRIDDKKIKEIVESGQLQLLQSVSRPLAQSDTQESWWQIVDSMQDGFFSVPPHQREPNRWSIQKQLFWIQRLASPIAPTGCILLYQKGDKQPVFLNDGLQRITTAQNLLAYPEKYGFTPEKAKILLKERYTTVQRRIYDSHEQAMVDFQFANLGSLMSPKEFYHGILAYTSGYDNLWGPMLERFHTHIKMAASRILSQRSLKRRNVATKHTHLRHDYVLIWKFITRRKDFKRFTLTTRPMEAEDLLKKDAIEFALRDLFTEFQRSTIEKGFEQLQRMVDAETALIKDIWDKVRPEKNMGMAASAYRWLLDIAIWKKFNQVPHDIWEGFIKDVLIHCRGKGQLSSPKLPGEVANLSVGQPNRLSRVCEITGNRMIEYAQHRKKSYTKMQPEPGCDVSHKLPFSIFGEGPVILEPSGRNRARGAKPIATLGLGEV